MKKLLLILFVSCAIGARCSDAVQVVIANDTAVVTRIDSVSDFIVVERSALNGDTVLVTDSDGTVKQSLSELRKPTGRNFWDWAGYVISFVSVLFLILLSSWKKLHESELILNCRSEFVRRFFSETSGFLKDTQLICASIAGIGTLLLSFQGGFDILSPGILTFVQTVTVASLAIAGSITITSRKK